MKGVRMICGYGDHKLVISRPRGLSPRCDRVLVSRGDTCNILFNASTGLTVKWDGSLGGDPWYCPWGPEIADIEVTTKCCGIRCSDGVRRPCGFCYKSNTPEGENMSLGTFQHVLDLLIGQGTLNQVALGVDAEGYGNPQMLDMMDYCLSRAVVPNVTVADVDEAMADELVYRCGSCAVSVYPENKEVGYESIHRLLEAARINVQDDVRVVMHLLVSEETEPFVREVLDDVENLPELQGLHSVVLLSLKRKGRGRTMHVLKPAARRKLLRDLLDRGIRFGTDSCAGPDLLKAFAEHPRHEEMEDLAEQVETCESGLFSVYVNVNAEAFPCSFIEGEKDWEHGIDLKDIPPGIDSFKNQVWNSKRMLEWREASLEDIRKTGCTHCQRFEI